MFGPLFSDDKKTRQECMNKAEVILLKLLKGTFDQKLLSKFKNIIQINKIDITTLKNWVCQKEAFAACLPLIPKEYIISLISNRLPSSFKKEILNTGYITQKLQKKLFFTYVAVILVLNAKNPALGALAKIMDDFYGFVPSYSEEGIRIDPLAINFLLDSKMPLNVVRGRQTDNINKVYTHCLSLSEQLVIDKEEILLNYLVDDGV